MSILQAVMTAPLMSAAPTYTLTPPALNVNEGSSLTFTVGGTNIPNGTYYWTVGADVAGISDFDAINGTVSVTGNSGTFSVTPTADDTTEGAETFNVTLRSDSITGTILATSESVTINDTSLTPVAPFSLNFPNTGDQFVLVSDIGFDWSLGTVYTIEFWSKQTNASTGGIRTVMSQGAASGRIDVGYANGHLLWNNSEPIFAEPTPGVWTHVAFVADGGGNITLYYNGVNQTTFNAGPALTDAASEVRIGRRGAAAAQYFYGKLAMIRVSSTAKYLADFNPTVTYGVGADTKLMLGSDTPLVDTSASAHTITNTGVTQSMDFPTTYTITPEANSVNEGASLEFTVGGTGIVNGNYYWTVTNSGDFGTASGSFSITSNTGSFSVTPSADVTTEGAETFTVSVRSVSITGTVLATSESITITDTSLAPVAPFSLQFVQAQTDYLDVAASADWNLSRNWTIEYWSKAAKASSGGDLLTVMCQDFTDGNGIQILYQEGFQIQGGPVLAAEPTPNVWTHVALVAVEGVMTLYYNGVSQYTGGYWSLNNTINPIRIGARGPADFQRFDGKLAMVRISNTNKYPTAFTATTTYGVEADTKLFLGSDTPLVDDKSHAVTNTGVTQSTDFPQNFIGHLNAYSGGNLGATYMPFGDPNITAFSYIPVGARITSNLSGFGIRQVLAHGAYYEGLQITYDNTGLPGGTVSTTSDTYNFYW